MKILIFNSILVVLLSIIIYSCLKPAHVKVTEYFYISNYTDKTIIHQLELDDYSLGNKLLSIYINKPCTDSLEFFFTGQKGNSSKPIVINYGNTLVYNLTDTTSLCFSTMLPPNDIKKRLYIEKSKESFYKDKEYHYISKYYSTINDSLLTLFQKDTSMLTKFKDYYNK